MWEIYKTQRDLQVGTVQKFRGINRFASLPNVTPDYALDCRNVIVSNTGGLEKLRFPILLAAPPAGQGAGPQRLVEFTQGNGTRQVWAQLGNAIYHFDGDALTPTLIETNALDGGLWSLVESNNILFGANGQRMQKWTGTAWQTWGIAAPAAGAAVGADLAQGSISAIVRASGEVTITTTLTHAFIVGDALSVAGVTDASFDGAFLVTAVADNTHLTYVQAGANASSSGGTVGGVLTGTYQWRYAYGNSVTGHISSASAIAGPVTAANGLQVLTAAAPADPQVDTVYWYRTLNGGADFYLIDFGPLADFTTYRDGNPDGVLNTSTIAQLINNPPPQGKYCCVSQGRIYVGGISGAPQDVAYSGYEAILSGRPEESFPPNNRLRMAIGADAVKGLGTLQAGVVIFGESDQMWMLRGIAEDITTTAPVIFSEYLEQLPWRVGCACHSSIQSTPYGLVWLAADRSVQLYNGTGKPTDLGEQVYPILRTITAGAEEQAQSAYFNWLERDWYALAIPTNGVQSPNLILVFDLTSDAAKNAGIFVFDIGEVDALAVIEDSNGQRKLAVGQNGGIYQLDVTSDTEAGVTDESADQTATANVLDAWWQSGYFGQDMPQLMKMWRWGSLVADNTGFNISAFVIDDATAGVRNPQIIALGAPNGASRFSVNRKGRRCSVEIVFPAQDASVAVQEMSMAYNPTSSR